MAEHAVWSKRISPLRSPVGRYAAWCSCGWDTPICDEHSIKQMIQDHSMEVGGASHLNARLPDHI